MEILAISQSHRSLMESILISFETRFDALESNLSAAPSNALEATPAIQDAGSSVSPSIHAQPPLRQHCSRYCRCQCHRITAVRAPSWMRNLAGSLVAQYTGGMRFTRRSCDTPACRRESAKVVRLGYSFPEWFLARAVSLYVSWGSLTNVGVSLHLTVPRVWEPPEVVSAFIHNCETALLEEKLPKRELMPTDITRGGNGYLDVSCPVAKYLPILKKPNGVATVTCTREPRYDI